MVQESKKITRNTEEERNVWKAAETVGKRETYADTVIVVMGVKHTMGCYFSNESSSGLSLQKNCGFEHVTKN